MSIEVPTEKTNHWQAYATEEKGNGSWDQTQMEIRYFDLVIGINGIGGTGTQTKPTSSFAGYDSLNRTNPIYGITQSPSQEDFQSSSPEGQ